MNSYPTAGMSQLPSTFGQTSGPGSRTSAQPSVAGTADQAGHETELALQAEKAQLDQYLEGLSNQVTAYRQETQQLVAAAEAQLAEAAHQQELAAARAEGVQIMATGGRIGTPPPARVRRYQAGGGNTPGKVYPSEGRAKGWVVYDQDGKAHAFSDEKEANAFAASVTRAPTSTAGNITRSEGTGRGPQDVGGPAPGPFPTGNTSFGGVGTLPSPGVVTPMPTGLGYRVVDGQGNQYTFLTRNEADAFVARVQAEMRGQAPAAATPPAPRGTAAATATPAPRAPATGAAAPAPAARPQVPVTASQPVATTGGGTRTQYQAAPAPPPEPEPVRHPFGDAWGVQLGPEYHPDALPLRQSEDGQYQVLMNGLWTPMTYEEADAQSQAGNVFVVDWDHPLNAQFEVVGPKGGVLSTPKAPSVATFDPALAEPEAPRAPSVATFAPEPTGPNAEQQANSARYPSHIEATPDMYPNARPFVAPAGYYPTPDTLATPPPARNRFGRTDAEQAEAERLAREGVVSYRDEVTGLGGTRRARGGRGARRYQGGGDVPLGREGASPPSGDVLPPGANAIVGEGRDPAGPGLRPELVIDPEAIRQGLVTMTTGASAANLPPDAFVIPLPPRLYDDASGLFQPFDQGVPVARNPDGQTFTAAAGGRLPPPRRLAYGGPPKPSGAWWQVLTPPTMPQNPQTWAAMGPGEKKAWAQAMQAYGFGPDAAADAEMSARRRAPVPVEAQPYLARGGRKR